MKVNHNKVIPIMLTSMFWATVTRHSRSLKHRLKNVDTSKGDDESEWDHDGFRRRNGFLNRTRVLKKGRSEIGRLGQKSSFLFGWLCLSDFNLMHIPTGEIPS